MPRTPDDILDEFLVLAAQDGDTAALERLVARWHPRLLRHAWHLSGDHELAADIAQEAWLGIVRGLRRLNDPARFRAWALSITSNKAADVIRRRRREPKHESLSEFNEPADAMGDSSTEPADARHAGLRRAIALLAPDHRAVLNLHYGEGLSIAELSLVLGVPPGTVKSRLFNARERLRTLLEQTTSTERNES